jgi:ribosome-associated protein
VAGFARVRGATSGNARNESDVDDTADEDPNGDEGPSKSARKRESTALQDLGEQLIDLPQTEFDALPLPDTLRDAVLLARRITKHGGLYRQKQYIGKLMRKFDAEPIRLALAARDDRQRNVARRFRRLEHWRDRVVAEGVTAIADLRSEVSAIDAKALEALARDARRERDTGATPRAARQIFTVIRDAFVAMDTQATPSKSGEE